MLLTCLHIHILQIEKGDCAFNPSYNDLTFLCEFLKRDFSYLDIGLMHIKKNTSFCFLEEVDLDWIKE